MKKFLFTIILLLALSLLGFFRYLSLVQNPVDENNTTDISFQIKKGQTVKEIAKNLDEKQLIKSNLAFSIYAKLHKLDKNILAGRFILKKSMNTPQILATLSDPQKAQTVITVQEGLRIKDIDSKLAELELIETGEFTNEVKKFNGWEYYTFLNKDVLEKLELPLEGYLYPDTYFLDPNDFQPHDLIFLMLDNFEKKTAEFLPQIKRHTIHEIITIASIIENEVFGEEDRKIVSGILWKRLESGWKLDADATLLYISDDRKISGKELESSSPYNTRKLGGLPPGPISNPSLESIEASMFPEESQYWFYLTTSDTGEVIYARSNEEHNENRAKYL
ncbi:endolytic transglycosylase MltG [Candidatus Peregrinibacteria bacterium]|nr:endolytic transglycosylase MltG [Candidatus Peregrinibacteria bacterium]